MSTSTLGQTTYLTPPQEVIDIIDAKPEPSVSLSPDAKWMVYLDRNAMPDISDLARRMIGVAGMRIDPIANAGFSNGLFPGTIGTKARFNDDDSHPGRRKLAYRHDELVTRLATASSIRMLRSRERNFG